MDTLRDHLSALYPARIPLQLSDKVLLSGEELGGGGEVGCAMRVPVQVRAFLTHIASSLGNQAYLTVKHMTSASFSLTLGLSFFIQACTP